MRIRPRHRSRSLLTRSHRRPTPRALAPDLARHVSLLKTIVTAKVPNQQTRPSRARSVAGPAAHDSLLSIPYVSKNRRRFAVPADRESLTAARGSPATP